MTGVQNPYRASFRNYHKREVLGPTSNHSSSTLIVPDAGHATKALPPAGYILGADAAAGHQINQKECVQWKILLLMCSPGTAGKGEDHVP